MKKTQCAQFRSVTGLARSFVRPFVVELDHAMRAATDPRASRSEPGWIREYACPSTTIY